MEIAFWRQVGRFWNFEIFIFKKSKKKFFYNFCIPIFQNIFFWNLNFSAADMSPKYAKTFGFTEMLAYWQMEANIEPKKMKIPENLVTEYTTKVQLNKKPNGYKNSSLGLERSKCWAAGSLWFDDLPKSPAENYQALVWARPELYSGEFFVPN